jgi:hypothetical protein
VSDHVTRADIIAIKRAARRAYLRKGDQESANIISLQIVGLTGWSRRTLDKYWRKCPFCNESFPARDPKAHKCKQIPETVR